MIQVYRFEVPGDPIPKGRPRFNTQTGRAYTPESTRDYEDLVRWSYRKAKGIQFPKGTPVAVELEIYRAMPGSWTHKHRDEAEGTWVTSRPDLDNFCKAILDGLSEAWDDDAQVVDVHMTKKWARIGRAIVTIRGDVADE